MALSSSKSLLKVEMIQKRALRFIHNDNNSSYESLLNNAKKSLMSVIRLRSLCVEIFKTVNNISPPFMKDIFCENDNGRTVREQNLKNLIVKRKRTVTFGTNSLTVLGPKLWNNLPSHLKLCENLKTFKNMIKNWDGSKCLCDQCNSLF